MPRRPPEDDSNFGLWVDWPKAIARVRGAKSDEKALDILKREFKLSVRLFEATTKAQIERAVRRERTAQLSRERIEAMAEAIAATSDDPNVDGKSCLQQARAIDAAIHARRRYEI